MWLVVAFIYAVVQAIVAYIDHFLSRDTSVRNISNPHQKVGGLILITSFYTIVGTVLLFIFSGESVFFEGNLIVLSLLSSIPLILSWILYFYILLRYSAHLIVPLFQLTTLWLLLFDFFGGSVISLQSLVGVGILSLGVYLIDTGSFRWVIPTRLIGLMLVHGLLWSISLYLVRSVSEEGVSSFAITAWQYLGIVFLGVLMWLFIGHYRKGLAVRFKRQRGKFLALSSINEILAQIGFLCANVGVVIAPFAAYFLSLSGLQGVVLLILFMLFPQEKKQIKVMQIFAIAFICIGVAIVELSRIWVT